MTWTPARLVRSRGALAGAGAITVALCLSACTPVSPTTGVPNASTGSDTGPGVLNVADAAISGNDPQLALKVSQSVLATDPKNLDALYHEGEAYYTLGRCEDAIAAYKLALTIDPRASNAQTGIGRCLLRQNAGAAELAFMAAVQDDPSNAAALNDLGISRDLQGKYAAATQPYQQALLLDPGAEATEVNLGMSLALSGDSSDALQYLGPLATGQEATPKIREDYAAALIAAGRDSEAQQVLSIDLSPDQVTAFMNGINLAISNAQATATAGATANAAASEPVTPTVTITPVTATPMTGNKAATAGPAPLTEAAVTPSGAPVVTTPMPATTAAPPAGAVATAAVPNMAAPGTGGTTASTAVVTPTAPPPTTVTTTTPAPPTPPPAAPPPATVAQAATAPTPATPPAAMAPAISAPPPGPATTTPSGPDSAANDQLVR
jgi:Flp pilus assembly protein TadD